MCFSWTAIIILPHLLLKRRKVQKIYFQALKMRYINGMEEMEPKKEKEELEEKDEESEEDVNVQTISAEELDAIIKSRKKDELKAVFETVPDIDIAEAANNLEITELIFLFREGTPSETAPIFDELSQDKKEELIKAMTDKELVALIAEQYADDLADTVGDMPANLAIRVLRAADKDMRHDINALLKYKDGTAGAIMTTEFLEFKQEEKVKDTIAKIREIGRDAETVYTVFVLNKSREFVGTVDLDDLIFASSEQSLEEIMNKDVPSCYASTDQEEVANMFRRYDLNAMAVLNDDNRLIGIVTIDDAVDVLTDEATEDIEAMSGVQALDDSYMKTSAGKMAKKCIPWIVTLLILGTFSSLILSIFEEKLAMLPIMAAFVPVLMDTGGNAGGQTISLMVRGLALKEFGLKDFGKIILKEILSALIVAIVVAGVGFVWFTIEQYTGIVHNSLASEGGLGTIWNGGCWTWEFAKQALKVSGCVALTMFLTIFVSKVVAVCLPFAVAACKKDPAVVSQPFLTTIVDVVSLLIYFGVATVLILQFIPSI